MDIQKLELLSAALRTVGGNFDVPTLDLILTVLKEVENKGGDISIGNVKAIAAQVMEKYQHIEKQ
ncbi:hypothetical protein [Flagellimonas onchidii]|uniref:hypothetical protein n=1 Tax=Flagellimonas onchidii TaxID=2562684 RepID=UPI0010A640C0|nr:hypothetical protein [Allomuricauda onchidii]